MTVVVRYLFALLVGVMIGAVGMAYLIQSDAGNLLVRRTEVVQDLQRRLDGAEQQRNLLAKQLEDVVARAGRMEQAFTDLERRFRTLGQERGEERGVERGEERGAPTAPGEPSAR